MAWWTKNGWRNGWFTRRENKKAARVASRREDRRVAHTQKQDDERPRSLP